MKNRYFYIFSLFTVLCILTSCSNDKLYNDRKCNELVKEDIVSITLKQDDYLGKKVIIKEENEIDEISSIIFKLTEEDNINKKNTSFVNDRKNIEFYADLAFEFQISICSKDYKFNFYTYSKDLVFYELVKEKYVAFNGDIETYQLLRAYLGDTYE